ncbi:hypothetical protein ARMSODRAFT_1068679 [Armillaria solidipes]|uniref:Uncharacterized protein n=1 Tax=Armillaria solidipes TaxID=1076256 RepID=A0A2H3ANK7_9AGAR|nr:hypothetical protein ARMSODRAFT_1068679 [Armillaria solidipes]
MSKKASRKENEHTVMMVGREEARALPINKPISIANVHLHRLAQRRGMTKREGTVVAGNNEESMGLRWREECRNKRREEWARWWRITGHKTRLHPLTHSDRNCCTIRKPVDRENSVSEMKFLITRQAFQGHARYCDENSGWKVDIAIIRLEAFLCLRLLRPNVSKTRSINFDARHGNGGLISGGRWGIEAKVTSFASTHLHHRRTCDTVHSKSITFIQKRERAAVIGSASAVSDRIADIHFGRRPGPIDTEIYGEFDNGRVEYYAAFKVTESIGAEIVEALLSGPATSLEGRDLERQVHVRRWIHKYEFTGFAYPSTKYRRHRLPLHIYHSKSRPADVENFGESS